MCFSSREYYPKMNQQICSYLSSHDKKLFSPLDASELDENAIKAQQEEKKEIMKNNFMIKCMNRSIIIR